jgi:hypothetical protein
MKCYLCKTSLTTAVRTVVPNRNKREITAFRDLCRPCYTQFMADKGYIFDQATNTWIQKGA